jgi:hypothetical protein
MVSFTLLAPATITFTLNQTVAGRRSHHRCVPATARNRGAGRCTAVIALRGRTVRHAHPGRNRFTYTRQGLSPGSYRLVASPTNNGQVGPPVTVHFKIVQ